MPSVAFLPHPPALVAPLAAGAAPELDELRQACDRAIDEVLDTEPDVLLVLGAGPHAGLVRTRTATFAGFGLQVPVLLPPEPAQLPAIGDLEAGELPLPHAVAAWLLAAVGERRSVPPVVAVIAAEDAPGIGAAQPHWSELRDWSAQRRTALLVMGDASACRTPGAPGAFDPRAQGFDDAVAAALATGDGAALAGLDHDLAAQLRVAGLPAWRLAAQLTAGSHHAGRLHQHSAPYGVGYLVATWAPAGRRVS